MKVIPYKVIKEASFVIRVNEYNTPDEYTNEYIGIQNPPEGHWYGLDCKYDDTVYRLHTDSMYNGKILFL